MRQYTKSDNIFIFFDLQVKPDLQIELSLSTNQLGWLDTALILPYAVAQVNIIGISMRTYVFSMFTF